MNQPGPQDQLARTQALDVRCSFAVSAPAGSGKTELLSQRVLALLAHCDQPEQVLSITFTRKAAGEMQERIVKALQSAQGPAPAEAHKQASWNLARKVLEQDAAHHWQLLQNPARLNIQTIDGLCRSLVKQLPLESGLGAVPDTLEDVDHAYQQAARRLLAQLQQPSLQTLLLHFDNHIESVEGLVHKLLSQRELWLGDVLVSRQTPKSYFEHALATLIEESTVRLQTLLGVHLSELALLADYAGGNVAEADPSHSLAALKGLRGAPPCDVEGLSLWQRLCELLLTKGKPPAWRKKHTVREGFPAASSAADKALARQRKAQISELIAHLSEIPGLLSLLDDIRHLPAGDIPEQEWGILNALGDVLPLAVAELKLVFQELGACDYSEITLAALQALGSEDDPTDLALKLDYQLRHILVDEFQDTSTGQLTLLNRLTSGWQRDDGRTVFVVGDGMQSIYGFRAANVGLFLEVRQQGLHRGQIPLQALDLQVNFRSNESLVAWNNRVFHHAFPAANDIARGAVSYSEAIAHHPDQPESGAELHVFDNSDQEAEHIARWVEQHLAACTGQAAQHTIAILVRSRNHLKPIVAALRQRDIHWQATEIDPLARRQCIQDALSLCRALLNPADRIAWLAVLRSPLVGVPLRDLHKLVHSGRETDNASWPIIYSQLNEPAVQAQLSPVTQQILERVLPLINSTWQQRQRKPLRDSLEGLWRALGGMEALLNPAHGTDMATFFALVAQYDRGGEIDDWGAFSRAIDKLYAAPHPKADSRVQVMTIHKSKGLEFDTVIIPALARQGTSDDKPLLLSQERINRDGEAQLLLSPLSPLEEAGGGSVYHYLRRENALKQNLEATRLLYVGATRAIRKLYLTASLAPQEEGQAKAPPGSSLLAAVWSILRDELHYHGEQGEPKPPETGPGQATVNTLYRLPPSWRPSAASDGEDGALLAPYRGRSEGFETAAVARPRQPQERQQAALGTVLHRCLRRITLDGLPQWPQSRLEQQRPAWRQQLLGSGLGSLSEQQLQGMLDRLQEAVATTLNSATGRWLLDHSHPHSACEQSISYRAGGRMRRAIIDRTFVSDGQRWIVDYKSATPQQGQTLHSFLAQQWQEHRQQLLQYQRLYRQLGESDTRLALYFPLLDCFSEWDAVAQDVMSPVHSQVP